MKRVLIAGIVAVAVTTGEASAQTVAVEISPEQRTTIRQYVVRHRVSPGRISEQVTVGAVVPSEVELAAVPSDWGPGLARYRYIYWNDRVVLVEPSTRKVIQIIE
jgi:hypothetical protein